MAENVTKILPGVLLRTQDNAVPRILIPFQARIIGDNLGPKRIEMDISDQF
jgi:hypothetical protein